MGPQMLLNPFNCMKAVAESKGPDYRNLENVCEVCLSEKTKTRLFPIEVGVKQLLREIFDLQYNEERRDYKICVQCIDFIEEAGKFKEMVATASEHNNASAENGQHIPNGESSASTESKATSEDENTSELTESENNTKKTQQANSATVVDDTKRKTRRVTRGTNSESQVKNSKKRERFLVKYKVKKVNGGWTCCGITYQRYFTLHSHLRKVHSGTKAKTSSNSAKTDAQNSAKADVKQRIIVCRCGKKFQNRSYLMIHKKSGKCPESGQP